MPKVVPKPKWDSISTVRGVTRDINLDVLKCLNLAG